jgi:predicted nucleic acid-binding protein
MSAGFLLDTNVVSELRKGARADARVRAWFDEHATDQLWLSVLVIGELRRGVELLRRRDKRAGKRLSDWLATITTEYGDCIIPITTEVYERWALLNVPDPSPEGLR